LKEDATASILTVVVSHVKLAEQEDRTWHLALGILAVGLRPKCQTSCSLLTADLTAMEL
jgi:hypothetical protein